MMWEFAKEISTKISHKLGTRIRVTRNYMWLMTVVLQHKLPRKLTWEAKDTPVQKEKHHETFANYHFFGSSFEFSGESIVFQDGNSRFVHFLGETILWSSHLFLLWRSSFSFPSGLICLTFKVLDVWFLSHASISRLKLPSRLSYFFKHWYLIFS